MDNSVLFLTVRSFGNLWLKKGVIVIELYWVLLELISYKLNMKYTPTPTGSRKHNLYIYLTVSY